MLQHRCGTSRSRRLAMKYLTALKDLTAVELISLAVLAAVAAGVVYGVLS
jgi:hypothetical protein